MLTRLKPVRASCNIRSRTTWHDNYAQWLLMQPRRGVLNNLSVQGCCGSLAELAWSILKLGAKSLGPCTKLLVYQRLEARMRQFSEHATDTYLIHILQQSTAVISQCPKGELWTASPTRSQSPPVLHRQSSSISFYARPGSRQTWRGSTKDLLPFPYSGERDGQVTTHKHTGRTNWSKAFLKRWSLD